jgi:hypothetical protein
LKVEGNRLPLALAVALAGLALPFLTWSYARAIDDRLVFEGFPHLVLLAFNAVAFAALAGACFFLRTSATAGGFLGLVAISVQLQMSYWQSHSSTSALLFLFYLPWAFIASAIGAFIGWGCGKVIERAPASGRALAAILLLAFAALNVRWANYGRFNLPAEVGIVDKDGGGLTVEKTTFFTTEERIGALTSIERRTCSADPEATLTFTGRGGAAFLSESGEPRGFLRFEDVAGFDVFPVDVEGDGICEFADRAGGWQPVGLIDSSGRYVFRYGKNMTTRRPEKLIEIEHSPQDFIPFDLGSDGRMEMLVPLLIVGRGETHVLDSSGARIREISENLEGSRALEGMLYTPSRGEVVVRDGSLSEVRRLPLGSGAPSFTFARWPDPSGAWHLVVLDGRRAVIRDLETGAEKAKVPGVEGGSLAFLGNRIALARGQNRRQFLSVADREGRKLYEEVLSPGGALFALSDRSFLISECTNEKCPTVWRYEIPGENH